METKNNDKKENNDRNLITEGMLVGLALGTFAGIFFGIVIGGIIEEKIEMNKV